MQIWLAQSESPAPDTTVDAGDSVASGFTGVVEGVLSQLPQILLAVVVLVAFFFFAKLVRRIVRKTLDKTSDRSESFSVVMSRLARALTIAIGVLIAMVVAIPSVDLGAVIGGLGIGSVAIGFAFQDILQNTLAGLLLLFRQPFEIGDQIEVQGYTGTVEAITIRETKLMQFDGQRILIPNSDVYSSSVRVQTAFEQVRSVVVVGVDYDADLAQARRVALEATQGVDGVLPDPAPQGFYTTLNTSTVDFDVRYWTASAQADIRSVQDRVVEAITNAMNDAGIGLPADIIELDARVSFAEAVKLARIGDGFGGAQNGQSQVKDLSAITITSGGGAADDNRSAAAAGAPDDAIDVPPPPGS